MIITMMTAVIIAMTIMMTAMITMMIRIMTIITMIPARIIRAERITLIPEQATLPAAAEMTAVRVPETIPAEAKQIPETDLMPEQRKVSDLTIFWTFRHKACMIVNG